MSLAEINIETRELPLPGGHVVTLRGLTLDDIATLITEYEDEIRALVTALSGRGDEPLTLDAVAPFLSESPRIAAAIIVAASGEPAESQQEAIAQVMKWPAPRNLIALVHVVQLTFGENPKALMESILSLAHFFKRAPEAIAQE